MKLFKSNQSVKASLAKACIDSLLCIRFKVWTAPEVEQSPRTVEFPAVLPRLQPAVVLQHPGGREGAWGGASAQHHHWFGVCARCRKRRRWCFLPGNWSIDDFTPALPLPPAGDSSKHEFQAETKKLLDIVARSLYSEKEVRGFVFCRERIHTWAKLDIWFYAAPLNIPRGFIHFFIYNPTRCSSGSWYPMAAMLWRNCATNWSQQVGKQHRWRSTCRRMAPRESLPSRYIHYWTRCLKWQIWSCLSLIVG